MKDMAKYHDKHMDDPNEWDNEEARVDPQPSGMTVFSLRLPMRELAQVREAAKGHNVSLSDFVRSAIRSQFTSVALFGISASSVQGITFSTNAPLWVGGRQPVVFESKEKEPTTATR